MSRNKKKLFNEQSFNKLFKESPSANSIYFDSTKSRLILGDTVNLNNLNKNER